MDGLHHLFLADWFGGTVFTALFWLIQIALIVHVIKTGRSYWWLLALFFAPGLGALIYFLVEILPGLRWRDPTGGWKPRGLVLRQLRAQLEDSPTVQTRLALADLLLAGGQTDEARSVAEECLHGVFKDDPTTLAAVARFRVEAGLPEEALAVLEVVNVEHDRPLSLKVALLRGRALLLAGRHEEALIALEEAESGYVGDEPRYFRALALHRAGRTAEAREVWREMRRHFRKAGPAWGRTERRWFKLAGERLAETRD